MTLKNILSISLCALASFSSYAMQSVSLASPDGKIVMTATAGTELTYSIAYDGTTVLQPSPIALTLTDGAVVGEKSSFGGVKRFTVDSKVASPFYRAENISEKYNGLTAHIAKGWDIEFRAYNDGVAYRFVRTATKPVEIASETVCYTFPADAQATVPYVNAKDFSTFEKQFFNSFENTYTVAPISELDSRRLIFLPAVVEAAQGVKLMFTESDLINYPGMYLNRAEDSSSLKGVFAPVPKKEVQGGHNRLQMLVTEREDFIARIDGKRSLPWRIVVVASTDATLAATNLTYLLGAPSRVADTSWIKPGKVAWDWWNNWNIKGVDFVSGVNNDTYKAYIDFAADHDIEYVILDEGWAVNLEADLMQIVPEIDLPMLVEYAKGKGVDLILWAGYKAFERDMENICEHYAKMGIKGFKVDFLDRDDQLMTDFIARAAETAARHNLVLDIHGTHKPAGLNRTYPNILNFEGVHGLEQMKWSKPSVDQMEYDATIPFIRQAAGPMDYTQGAMRNASKKNYYPCNSEPMSQGTRAHQLGLYVIFDSPLTMLCDTPSNYVPEKDCIEYIAEIPTTWDETLVLDGKMGEYVVMARRKGDTWYLGGITDWNERDIEVPLTFLVKGTYKADIYRDGVNARRAASDYKRVKETVSGSDTIKFHLAPGGGFAAKFSK